MKVQHKYCPDFRACPLEDRLGPVVSNMGVGTIVLTTGGYALVMSPFPVNVADPDGASGGPGYLTPTAMTGGVSGLLPSSGTAVRPLATTAPATSNRGTAVTIVVGSGADDAGATIIPPVTRNTIANDAINPRPQIGRVSLDRSEVLTRGQVHGGGGSTEVSGKRSDPGTDEQPGDPLPIRIRSTPHRLATENSRGAG
jgi:hypothetical protein